jgi:hypothetical protein
MALEAQEIGAPQAVPLALPAPSWIPACAAMTPNSF